jgi:peptidyl-prolyl cis-trans isomerase C
MKKPLFSGSKMVLLLAGACSAALLLSGCGEDVSVKNPFEGLIGRKAQETIAARINGSAITVADVQSEAVRMGELTPGEALSPDSPLFNIALDNLIDRRLLAIEAEAKGLDRGDEVKRQLDWARENILSSALMDQILTQSINEDAIKKAYEEQVARLSQQGEQVKWAKIVAADQSTAEAARTRIDRGEDFRIVAMETSTDARTRTEGGVQELALPAGMPPVISRLLTESKIGDVIGPVRDDTGSWIVFRVIERGPAPPMTLEQMRPALLEYMKFNQIQQTLERVRNTARVERMIGRETGAPAPAPTQQPAQQAAPPAQSPPPAVAAAPQAPAPAAPAPTAVAAPKPEEPKAATPTPRPPPRPQPPRPAQPRPVTAPIQDQAAPPQASPPPASTEPAGPAP